MVVLVCWVLTDESRERDAAVVETVGQNGAGSDRMIWVNDLC